jgi:hypothetical protein
LLVQLSAADRASVVKTKVNFHRFGLHASLSVIYSELSLVLFMEHNIESVIVGEFFLAPRGRY